MGLSYSTPYGREGVVRIARIGRRHSYSKTAVGAPLEKQTFTATMRILGINMMPTGTGSF
jgi:hypothetical protein